MSLIPDTKIGKIEFCEQHQSAWSLNSVAMGSSAAAVTAWAAKVVASRSAYEAQKAAKLALRNATTTLDDSLRDMIEATTSIIKQVRARADLDGNGIYALASLPVPALPTPKPPPGKPTELTVTLDELGSLHLAWKCANPEGTAGTMYQVWRKIGAETALTYLGGTGQKKFDDNTLPAGSASVVYAIQAVRSTAMGLTATFNVNFGVSAGGLMMIKSITEVPSSGAKIAA
jgi:hypothetical protein